MKNIGKTARVAIMLLVLCMISTAMLSGTFAKYTSEYSGQDTALIAKWLITSKIGKDTSTGALTPGTGQTFDLFSHAYTDAGKMLQKVNVGTLEAPVYQYIVAPGVNGDFFIGFKNDGDVAVDVNFNFKLNGVAVDATGQGAPIEYSVDNGTTWIDLLALKNYLETEMTDIPYIDDSGTAGVTENDIQVPVLWRWPYSEANHQLYDVAGKTHDQIDTTWGTDSGAGTGTGSGGRLAYILDITAIASQVEPGPDPATGDPDKEL